MLRRLVSTAPPPRRRARQGPSSRAPLPPPPFVQHAVSAPVSPSDQDRFNAPLYTLKAFAIATAIVMSTATASVAGAMAYLDVRNTTEFAARMLPGDPVLLAASAPQHESFTPTTFDHDAAEQRLAEAFDKGGLDAWTEIAARELEAEIEVERSRKHTS